MGRRAFAVAGSHDFARHRQADALADGGGSGARGVEALDPGGMVGEGEACGVVEAEGRGEEVEEQEDESDLLDVHDLETWSGFRDSTAEVEDVNCAIARLCGYRVRQSGTVVYATESRKMLPIQHCEHRGHHYSVHIFVRGIEIAASWKLVKSDILCV